MPTLSSDGRRNNQEQVRQMYIEAMDKLKTTHEAIIAEKKSLRVRGHGLDHVGGWGCGFSHVWECACVNVVGLIPKRS